VTLIPHAVPAALEVDQPRDCRASLANAPCFGARIATIRPVQAAVTLSQNVQVTKVSGCKMIASGPVVAFSKSKPRKERCMIFRVSASQDSRAAGGRPRTRPRRTLLSVLRRHRIQAGEVRGLFLLQNNGRLTILQDSIRRRRCPSVRLDSAQFNACKASIALTTPLPPLYNTTETSAIPPDVL